MAEGDTPAQKTTLAASSIDDAKAVNGESPSSFERLKSRVAFFAEIAVILTVVIMIAASYLQLQADRDLNQRETTSSLVTLSFSPPVFEAKAKVTTELSVNAEQYATMLLAEPDPESEDVSAGPAEIDLPPDLREAFVVLTEFYTSVVKCRTSGACHPEFTDDFFKEDICGFNALYAELAEARIEREYGRSINDEIVGYCGTPDEVGVETE